MKYSFIKSLGIAAVTAVIVGCSYQAPFEKQPDTHSSSQDSSANQPSNRLDIPAVVRRNLGITFEHAAYRPVAATLVIPGQFELLPSAQQDYRLPVAGRVMVNVTPLQNVQQGDVLLEIDAPAWRQLQGDLVNQQAALQRTRADITKAQALQVAARSLSDSRVAEDDVYAAEVRAAEAAHQAAQNAFNQLLAQASTMSGLPQSALSAKHDGQPTWQGVQTLKLRAITGGKVSKIDVASGTWVEAGAVAMQTVQPQAVQFRGQALQVDLIDGLQDGQAVRITPPEGQGSQRRIEPIIGTVRLGVGGDARSRSIDVVVDITVDNKASAELTPSWIRPQVIALAEVALAGDPDTEELAIPERAIIQDGLETVFFRRDPNNPDAVIRTIADLGPSDGTWVTVYSGLAEGDEVVIDGVYQLKLATTGQEVTAGHFHADGTWHEGEH